MKATKALASACDDTYQEPKDPLRTRVLKMMDHNAIGSRGLRNRSGSSRYSGRCGARHRTRRSAQNVGLVSFWNSRGPSVYM